MNFDSDTNVIEVGYPPPARQGRRRLPAAPDPYRARHGLRSRKSATNERRVRLADVLGVRLSLLFAACTAAVSPIAGLIFSRAIDEHFVELDHMAMSAKLAVFSR